MELPSTDHLPELVGMPKDLTMIVFGPPKVGKTTFGAAFPKSLVIECERGGARYVKGRVLECFELNDVRKAWELLKANPDYCETIVIDSIDQIAQWIEGEICKELGLGSILDSKEKQKHGAQWGLYAERVLGLLNAWKALGKRVIYLAHTKKAEMDSNSLVINPKTINLYGQTAGRVISIVENIGHMYAKEDEQGKIVRVLSFAPGLSVEAGARHPALNNRIIPIPQSDPYGAFAALFAPQEQAVDKPLALPKPETKANGHKREKAPAGAAK